MKIYKNKIFARFARAQRISDSDLCQAIKRAERGLVDADLGGGVIKQRVARPNEGRSGGFRTIVLFRTQERAFFVFGFAKNQRENISESNLRVFKLLAKALLDSSNEEIEAAVKAHKLEEVNCNEEDL